MKPGPASRAPATISPACQANRSTVVRGVVPQQVVGPRARLAERVDVPAAEEVGLHVHLWTLSSPRNAPVHPLVARG